MKKYKIIAVHPKRFERYQPRKIGKRNLVLIYSFDLFTIVLTEEQNDL